MPVVYDLNEVICTIGGVDLSGYGTDDAIEVEWDGPVMEPKLTADGDPIYSRTNNRACKISVTLSQHSLAYSLLMPLLEAQQVGPVLLPLAFNLTDPSNFEAISGVAVFTDRPAPSKKKTAGDVVFKLHIGKALHTPPVNF